MPRILRLPSPVSMPLETLLPACRSLRTPLRWKESSLWAAWRARMCSRLTASDAPTPRTASRRSARSVSLKSRLREAGFFEVKTGKFPFLANSKATILGQHEGFIKVVAEAKYGEILGVHAIGPLATEIIAEPTRLSASKHATTTWPRRFTRIRPSGKRWATRSTPCED